MNAASMTLAPVPAGLFFSRSIDDVALVGQEDTQSRLHASGLAVAEPRTSQRVRTLRSASAIVVHDCIIEARSDVPC